MSKWKDKEVTIIQVTRLDTFLPLGLGNDGKLYQWEYNEGAWRKYWAESDDPL